jgi:phospholipid/cholesterol/gamma-HCH transport system substrate-binding protein
MTARPQTTNLRVGVFISVGLLLAALAIFAVGEKSGLFEGKTTVYVHFADISGLVPGASVRLAGLDVGTVSAIEFSESLERRQARVELSIKSRYMKRIRRDSYAFVDSKGLLGDKIINITLGSAQSPSCCDPRSASSSPDKPCPCPQVVDGETLKTKPALSMENIANKLEEAISSITKVTKTADVAISQLATDEVRGDVGRIVASTANILEEVERGEGFAHRAIYDPKYGNEVEQLLAETRATVTRLRTTLERIDRNVAAVERGDGMLHELLYGDSGKSTMEELRGAASEIAAITRAVREGDGLLHSVIYDPNSARGLEELNQAAERINRIEAEIEKGHGTLGGLAMDPTVYEDLKGILGDVERNVLLKHLIRLTIKEGGIERPATMRTEGSK